MKTMKIWGILAALALTAMLALPEGHSQRGKGGSGLGYKGEYQGEYDPQTVTTVKGIVETVAQNAPASGISYGIHLVLKTDSKTLSVHLGPAWFIDRQNIRIEEGDTIEVKGSKITYEGKPTIIAAEVKKANTVLKLRDKNGFPVWVGTRKK